MHICIALIHLVVLVFLFSRSLRGRNFPRIELFLLVFLLVWADFVAVGYTLSVFSALGNSLLFIILTILYAIGAYPLLRKIAPVPLEATSDPVQETVKPLWLQIGLTRFFVLSGIAGLVCNLILAFRLFPNNPDSLAYRIPRVFFYLSHGSLSHFGNGVDPRLLYYPLNGILLQAFVVHHRLGPCAFNLVSCVSWVVVGLAVYRLCRNFSLPKTGSMGTAWIICFTPNVLAQATSTNDELMAAAPLLIAIILAARWFQTRHVSHLILAAIAGGISFGTKLHFFFFWPMYAAIAAGCAGYLIFRREMAWKLAKPFLLPAVAACGMAGAISLPFAIFNVARTGHIFNRDITDQLSNKPFKVAPALQTVVLYGSQIFLNPALDLDIANNDASRRALYERVNQFCNNTFFRWVNQGPAYMGWAYRFQGIWSSYSYYLSEESVFLGFTPWLFLLGLFCLRDIPTGTRSAMALLLLSFWTYFITYSISTKYIETTGIYFAYALVIGGAGLAVLWFPSGSRALTSVKAAALSIVIVTHVIFAVNLFEHNVMRNLHGAISSKSNMRARARLGGRIVSELKSANDVHLVFTHWEPAFYSLMRRRKGIEYL